MTPPKRRVDPRDLIIEGSRILGIPITPDASARMLRHLEILRKWNRRLNLTSLRDTEEMVVRHTLDSLTVFKVLPMGAGFSLLDVGSGAGFPGVVLRIADESFTLTLLDRDLRKIVYLKHMVHELGLSGVAFLNISLGRALESSSRPPYDVVVSRAFSSDPALLDEFHLLIRGGGFMVHMGGPSARRTACPLGHFTPAAVWDGILPFSDILRRVTLYQRVE